MSAVHNHRVRACLKEAIIRLAVTIITRSEDGRVLTSSRCGKKIQGKISLTDAQAFCAADNICVIMENR